MYALLFADVNRRFVDEWNGHLNTFRVKSAAFAGCDGLNPLIKTHQKLPEHASMNPFAPVTRFGITKQPTMYLVGIKLPIALIPKTFENLSPLSRSSQPSLSEKIALYTKSWQLDDSDFNFGWCPKMAPKCIGFLPTHVKCAQSVEEFPQIPTVTSTLRIYTFWNQIQLELYQITSHCIPFFWDGISRNLGMLIA